MCQKDHNLAETGLNAEVGRTGRCYESGKLKSKEPLISEVEVMSFWEKGAPRSGTTARSSAGMPLQASRSGGCTLLEVQPGPSDRQDESAVAVGRVSSRWSMRWETYPDRGSATWLWMRSNAGMVSGGRRPNPHSVATPKSATHCCAALMRVSVPSTPSVTWTNPR